MLLLVSKLFSAVLPTLPVATPDSKPFPALVFVTAYEQYAVQAFEASNHLAHLWLVPNPAHNPRGDFGLSADGLALNLPADDPAPRYTYSTIALLRAELFAAPWCDIPPGNPSGIKAPLAPLLRRAMDNGRVSAQLYTGRWTDVGTPERLAELNTLSSDPLP